MTTPHLLVSLGQSIGYDYKSLRLCTLKEAFKAEHRTLGRRARDLVLSVAKNVSETTQLSIL